MCTTVTCDYSSRLLEPLFQQQGSTSHTLCCSGLADRGRPVPVNQGRAPYRGLLGCVYRNACRTPILVHKDLSGSFCRGLPGRSGRTIRC